MNLWDIQSGVFNRDLMMLVAGSVSDARALESKIGEVQKDGGGSLGNISSYFVHRYGFSSTCTIAPFTGDNPSTILALPLCPLDCIVSLGTSTTFLMSTRKFTSAPCLLLLLHS